MNPQAHIKTRNISHSFVEKEPPPRAQALSTPSRPAAKQRRVDRAEHEATIGNTDEGETANAVRQLSASVTASPAPSASPSARFALIGPRSQFRYD